MCERLPGDQIRFLFVLPRVGAELALVLYSVFSLWYGQRVICVYARNATSCMIQCPASRVFSMEGDCDPALCVLVKVCVGIS